MVSQETWETIKDEQRISVTRLGSQGGSWKPPVEGEVGNNTFPILARVNRGMGYRQVLFDAEHFGKPWFFDHEAAFEMLAGLGKVDLEAFGSRTITFPEGIFKPESQEESFLDLSLSGRVYAGHGQCASSLGLEETIELLRKAADSLPLVQFQDWTILNAWSWGGESGSSYGGYLSLHDGDILFAMEANRAGVVTGERLKKKLTETAEGFERIGSLKPMDIEKTVWSSRVKQPDYWVAI